MGKPSNWYGMSQDERRVWERAERERSDLEYEKDREREARERSDRELRRQKESAAAARGDYENRLEEAYSEACEAQAELALAVEFLRGKGLEAEYDEWASYRRTG